MNQTCFQNVEEWSETNITGNNSFQWCFLTWSQVKWTDMENYVEFLSNEMPDIKIDDNCLFEVERRMNVHLNFNKVEELESQHAEKSLARNSPNSVPCRHMDFGRFNVPLFSSKQPESLVKKDSTERERSPAAPKHHFNDLPKSPENCSRHRRILHRHRRNALIDQQPGSRRTQGSPSPNCNVVRR
ncbi:hypothetical protein TNCV_1503181 [Trichonephila clavipes]|uniref:Uncharacterized protein n=1 Tax=Trichonephila clavipes TaxID=2585209 RepID=A0A8X6RR34_TRICX|nr:hypothetical protein TNCV_1503181 [Trichonephila clavipes]